MVTIKSKLLLKPEDFIPSFKRWTVQGVLNPAAVRLPNNKIMLYIIVAESAGKDHEELKKCPRIVSKKDFKVSFDRVKGEILSISGRYIFLADGGCMLKHISHFRKVILEENGWDVNEIEQKPAFLGTSEDGDYGVEDPRISQIGNRYIMSFVGVSAEEGISTYLTTSKNFKTWGKRWLAFHEQNKDVVIFPEKIKGKYVALHRPEAMFSVYKPSIWVSYSPDLVYWGANKVLIRPRPNSWECERIGSGPVPIKTKEGWLVIYHGVENVSAYPDNPENEEKVSRYSAGALLLHKKDPSKVLARSSLMKPLFEPTEKYEEKGFMNNVVFPTGAVIDQDKKHLLIYSGGADKVISVKKILLKEIFNSMEWY